MKSFLKIMLATMAGMLLMGVLTFLFFIIIGALSMSGSVAVKPNSVLVADLRQVMVEERVSSDDPQFMRMGGQEGGTIGLNDWNEVLKKASEDPHIKGI